MEDFSNNRLWTKDYEERVIHILQSSGECDIVKNGKFYYCKKNFKLVSMAGVTKVATIKDNRIMAIKENIFSIISDFHSACGHKGEKKTYKAVSEHYANISMPFIKQFITQCERCAEKSKRISQNGIVVRPITSNDLNQRGQVDLVDFQSLPDGEFKYILHYKEHLTKYSFLRPLVSKKAIEVARELFNIFLDFGAPHILQSDNGREFTADIIKELASLWPDLIFINGRPRHPQSQGSVERSNCTLKNSLIAWMRDNRTSSWSLGLRIVQWGMNITYHEGIKISPYVAMFGQKAKMSLTSKLPKDFLKKISTGILEEEMEDLMKFDNENEKQETIENIFESITRQQSNDDENNVAAKEFSLTTEINSNNSFAQEQVEAMIIEQQKFEDIHANIAEETFCIGKEINTNNLSLQIPELRETLSNTVPLDTENQIATENVLHPAVKYRNLASKNLLAQASKMLDRSNKTLSNFKPGDNVLVGISQFDRGRGDPPNLIGVVMDEKDGKYKIGTEHGIIDHWLERNCVQATKYSKLKITDVPNEENSIRILVRLSSVGSGQGYQRCLCIRNCLNNRCRCFKNKMICNSACHAGKSCMNIEK